MNHDIQTEFISSVKKLCEAYFSAIGPDAVLLRVDFLNCGCISVTDGITKDGKWLGCAGIWRGQEECAEHTWGDSELKHNIEFTVFVPTPLCSELGINPDAFFREHLGQPSKDAFLDPNFFRMQ